MGVDVSKIQNVTTMGGSDRFKAQGVATAGIMDCTGSAATFDDSCCCFTTCVEGKCLVLGIR